MHLLRESICYFESLQRKIQLWWILQLWCRLEVEVCNSGTMFFLYCNNGLMQNNGSYIDKGKMFFLPLQFENRARNEFSKSLGSSLWRWSEGVGVEASFCRIHELSCKPWTETPATPSEPKARGVDENIQRNRVELFFMYSTTFWKWEKFIWEISFRLQQETYQSSSFDTSAWVCVPQARTCGQHPVPHLKHFPSMGFDFSQPKK